MYSDGLRSGIPLNVVEENDRQYNYGSVKSARDRSHTRYSPRVYDDHAIDVARAATAQETRKEKAQLQKCMVSTRTSYVVLLEGALFAIHTNMY